MSKIKLCQIIAIEKGVKSRSHSDLTNLHRASQYGALYNGAERVYASKDDEGETYPPESSKVQLTYQDVISQMCEGETELIDTVLTKDEGNTEARSDVTVDGEVVLSKVPVTTLIFLEKKMDNVRTFIEKLPIQDPAVEWEFDEDLGYSRAQPVRSQKTKKVAKPVTLAEATVEHPAQVQLVSEDIVVGYWNTTQFTSAIPLSKKKELLGKVAKLHDALKLAREEANSKLIEKHQMGETIFKHLFG